MAPPPTTLDFTLATVALAGSTWWFVRTRNDSESEESPSRSGTTGLALLGACGLLWWTLVRFSFLSAVFSQNSGFSDTGPYWRVLPAIGEELVSIILLAVVLKRQYQ